MDISGSFGGTSRVKNFGQALEILDLKKHVGADIDGPQARTRKTSVGKTSG